MKLQDLREDESLVLEVRRHWVTIVPALCGLLLVIVAAFFFMARLFALGTIGVVLWALFVAAPLLYAIRRWMLWRGTVMLVTSGRIVDVDRTALFREVVSDASYENITSISYETDGIFQTLCRAGNVTISTFGGTADIAAVFVPCPAHVRDTIVDAGGARRGRRYEERKGGGDADVEETLPAQEDLVPEDKRAVTRYADHLKKRRALHEFFDDKTPDHS